jgi:Asp-tRNA(Asn)/Glu-tRNA(Gln) amidotransferase B subunit
VRIERIQVEQDSGKSSHEALPAFAASAAFPAAATAGEWRRVAAAGPGFTPFPPVLATEPDAVGDAEAEGAHVLADAGSGAGAQTQPLAALSAWQRALPYPFASAPFPSPYATSVAPEPATLIDLNRAGVGLLEVVTAPDLRSAGEAGAFLRKLHGLLRHVGVSEGAIEEGQLRCDVNVSVRRWQANGAGEVAGGEAGGEAGAAAGGGGQRSAFHQPLAAAASSGAPTPAPGSASAEQLSALLSLPPRVEMKNVASIRAVERAIECEAARQVALLEGRPQDAARYDSNAAATASRGTATAGTGVGDGIGDAATVVTASAPAVTIRRETRLYDAASHTTSLLRVKEGAADYRFLPEPDLLPLFVDPARVAAAADAMPALPDAIRGRLADPALHGLSWYDGGVLVGTPGAAAYYDAALAAACAAAAQPLAPELLACAKPRGVATAPAAGFDAANPAAVGAAAASAAGGLSREQRALAKAVNNWLASELFGRLAAITEPAAAAGSDALSGAAASLSLPPALAAVADVGVSGAGRVPASIGACRLPAVRLGQLAAAVVGGRISGKTGKQVLQVMLAQAYGLPLEESEGDGEGAQGQAAAAGKSANADAAAIALSPAPLAGCGGVQDPLTIAAARGWLMDAMPAPALRALCEAALADPASASAVAKYRAGHERAAGSVVARVLADTGGRASPAAVASMVGELLGPCPKRERASAEAGGSDGAGAGTVDATAGERRRRRGT